MGDLNDTDIQEQTGIGVEEKITKPPMYKVLLHNDDYTTREFVVEILINIFSKSTAEATRLMLHVHNNGLGVIGVYTYETAETKVKHATDLAQDFGYPLRLSIEQE